MTIKHKQFHLLKVYVIEVNTFQYNVLCLDHVEKLEISLKCDCVEFLKDKSGVCCFEKLLTLILNFCTDLCSLFTDVSVYGKTVSCFFFFLMYSLKLKSTLQTFGVGIGIKMW